MYHHLLHLQFQIQEFMQVEEVVEDGHLLLMEQHQAELEDQEVVEQELMQHPRFQQEQ